MPAYVWSCLACGKKNDPGSERCSICSCPSNAAFKEIAKCREEHVARGGVILPSAGSFPDEDDYAIMKGVVKVVGKVMAVLFFFGIEP